jgi:acyl carrier protein
MSDTLKSDLKQLIVETVQLPDLKAEEIPDDEALFGEGLDLDSIDALELVLQLEKRYGIKISSSEESKEALRSVNTLAAYIEAHGTAGA